MGELFQLRGYQLVMTFSPTYPEGEYDEVIVKFGPFQDIQSLMEWQELFIESFQEEFEKEEKIIECPISSVDAESHDPRDAVFYHEDPILMAQEALDMLLLFGSREYQEKSNGPFLWKALIRLEMKEEGFPLDTPVISGPFECREDIPAWCTQFAYGMREKVSQVKGVKLEIFDEDIVVERDHDFDKDDEYLLNASADPTKEGQKLFSEVIRDLIAACNVRT